MEPTTRMPSLADKLDEPATLGNSRAWWSGFRKSLYWSFRAPGAWAMAVAGAALAVKVPEIGWIAELLGSGVAVVGYEFGRGVQSLFPDSDASRWSALHNIAPGWYGALVAVGLITWISKG